jgi:hypothetical protein
LIFSNRLRQALISWQTGSTPGTALAGGNVRYYVTTGRHEVVACCACSQDCQQPANKHGTASGIWKTPRFVFPWSQRHAEPDKPNKPSEWAVRETVQKRDRRFRVPAPAMVTVT